MSRKRRAWSRCRPTTGGLGPVDFIKNNPGIQPRGDIDEAQFAGTFSRALRMVARRVGCDEDVLLGYMGNPRFIENPFAVVDQEAFVKGPTEVRWLIACLVDGMQTAVMLGLDLQTLIRELKNPGLWSWGTS